MEAFLKKGNKKAVPKKEDISKVNSESNFNMSIKSNQSSVQVKSSKLCISSKANLNVSTKHLTLNTEDVEMEVEDEAQTDKKRYQPWVEKYRPSKIDEISHQPEVVSALRKSVSSGKVPHLLLHGPPGTGKTSTILALAKELFGPEFYKSRILELNASDDRGIGMVREKIKKFAQK